MGTDTLSIIVSKSVEIYHEPGINLEPVVVKSSFLANTKKILVINSLKL